MALGYDGHLAMNPVPSARTSSAYGFGEALAEGWNRHCQLVPARSAPDVPLRKVPRSMSH